WRLTLTLTLRSGFFVALACARVFGSGSPHAGLAFDEFDLTLVPGTRTEAAGPFYYRQESDFQRTWGIPPVYAYTTDPKTDFTEYDFLYPLLTFDRFGEQYRWQFFQLLSWAGGRSQTENERRRFTLFPVYFRQWSSDPAEEYTAIFPFYGHLKNRLFRDEI